MESSTRQKNFVNAPEEDLERLRSIISAEQRKGILGPEDADKEVRKVLYYRHAE